MKKTYPPGETKEDRVVRARTHHLLRRDKQTSALIRQETYAKLTPLQKITLLDYKLGFNVGAVKERNKLTTENKK